MKKVIFVVLLVVLSGCCTPTGEPPKVVLVVYHKDEPVFDAMMDVYWISFCNVSKEYLKTDELSAKEVERRIHEIDPDLIFAVGRGGLYKVKGVYHIPILYTFVLAPHMVVADRPNIIGLPVLIPPGRKFETIRSFMPNVKAIGLIYMKETEIRAEKINRIASGSGVRILSERLEKKEDFSEALWRMEGKIDLFWMLPDIHVFTPAAMKELLDYSYKTKTPVFTYSSKWVERGAFFSSEIDLRDIGSQCSDISEKILSGVDVRTLKPLEPRKELMSINIHTAVDLSVDFNHDMSYKMRSYWDTERYWYRYE